MSIESPGSIRELIQRLYGVGSLTTPTAKTTGGAGSIGNALPNNGSRIAALIINLSPNVLYVLPGLAPSASNGIRLDPNGGRIILNFKDDLELVAMEWNVFDATGGGNYLISETVLVPAVGP